MKNNLRLSAVAALLLLFSSESLAGCKDLPQPQARAALQILKTQNMVVEYCEKCLGNIHRLIGIRSTGIICNDQNMCRILINGEEVDTSHLFAQNTDGKEENIAFAVQCKDALLYNPRFLNFDK